MILQNLLVFKIWYSRRCDPPIPVTHPFRWKMNRDVFSQLNKKWWHSPEPEVSNNSLDFFWDSRIGFRSDFLRVGWFHRKNKLHQAATVFSDGTINIRIISFYIKIIAKKWLIKDMFNSSFDMADSYWPSSAQLCMSIGSSDCTPRNSRHPTISAFARPALRGPRDFFWPLGDLFLHETYIDQLRLTKRVGDLLISPEIRSVESCQEVSRFDVHACSCSFPGWNIVNFHCNSGGPSVGKWANEACFNHPRPDMEVNLRGLRESQCLQYGHPVRKTNIELKQIHLKLELGVDSHVKSTWEFASIDAKNSEV